MTPPSSSCGLATGSRTLTSSLFCWSSQPCGPQHTLHLIREYYLTLRGQHSSTSWGFCQQCISFCGCPTSISVVPATTCRTPRDPRHLSRTYTVSLSRCFCLKFLLIWTTYCIVSLWFICSPAICFTRLKVSQCVFMYCVNSGSCIKYTMLSFDCNTKIKNGNGDTFSILVCKGPILSSFSVSYFFGVSTRKIFHALTLWKKLAFYAIWWPWQCNTTAVNA